MIPLNAYPAYIRRGMIYLRFPYRYREFLLDRIIDIFEENLGGIVSEEGLVESIRGVLSEENDLRVSNMLYHSMLVFYRLETQKIPLILSKKRVSVRDEWDLRSIFYGWVQEKFGGFIPLEERENALEAFCEEFGIERRKLEVAISGGIISGYKLVRRISRRPSVSDLVHVANFLLIEKTLGISEDVSIVFEGVESKGTFVKDLVYRSKRARLMLDFKVEGKRLKCHLYGPLQLFKHPSPIYGDGIRYVLMGLLYRHDKWWLKATIRYRKRRCIFTISSESPAAEMRPPWTYTGEMKSLEPFDSYIERRLYHILCRMFPDSEVLRESSVVVTSNNRIFLPDFTIRSENGEVHVELVGFWTEEYARKKREKLDEVYRDGVENIVAIVDRKLYKYFKGAKYPVVFYDKELSIARKIREAIAKAVRK